MIDIKKAAAAIFLSCGISSAAAAPLPAPTLDAPRAEKPGETRSIVFSGGCFWGVQAVFQHVRGVKSAASGYAGGSADTADYQTVSSGATGHAESVQVVYDPAEVSLGDLLRVFFSVAHDPTQVDRQGPDVGTQYRSAIFFSSPEQEKIARAYVAQLDAAKAFGAPVATKVGPLDKFYPAEDYHQNYYTLHPESAYIQINDAPKVRDLKRFFPELYVE